MAINLAEKYSSLVDEKFAAQSKRAEVTNQDYDWVNAHTVNVYTVTTASMNNYDRAGTGTNISRYGVIQGLDATTQQMTLSKDRSFTYAIDKLDEDETVDALEPVKSLERQMREVIIPEIDTHVFGVMVAGAGNTVTKTLTSANVYSEIVTASETLDNAEVPDDKRYLLVTPSTFALMKENDKILMSCDVAEAMRIKGVVAYIDGCTVIKVPANRLPAKTGFVMCHPSATVSPVKLEDYTIHPSAPFINGSLIEGRVVYDAFVLDNKKNGIYVCKNA